MKSKQITLKKVGYEIHGTATIFFWGSGEGEVRMDKYKIYGSLTKEKLLGGLNDGQFGCQGLKSAFIHIYELYENGVVEHLKDLEITRPVHLKHAFKGV